MARVLLLHGVAHGIKRKFHCFRNYVSDEHFVSFLDQRTTRFGAWDPQTERDVLTVDDATFAGGKVCELAASRGHHSILFVNPHQVITGEPYFFSVMDAAFDQRAVDHVTLDGEEFNLAVRSSLQACRQKIRRRLMPLPATEALAEARRFGALLGVKKVRLYEHVTPLTIEDLRRLARSGVQIENHGWDHRDISVLSEQQLEADIVASRDWLRAEVGVDSSLYAVPYGVAHVPSRIPIKIGCEVFLADSELPLAQVQDHCWNRRDIAPDFTD